MGLDHYAVLGVNPGVSEKELKKAYRKKCLQYHPDKNPGGEAMFKQVAAAFQVLSDSKRRADYDIKQARRQHAKSTMNRGGGSQPSEPAYTYARRESNSLNISEIIRRDREMAKKKADLKKDLGFDPAKSIHLQDLLRRHQQEMGEHMARQQAKAQNEAKRRSPEANFKSTYKSTRTQSSEPRTFTSTKQKRRSATPAPTPAPAPEQKPEQKPRWQVEMEERKKKREEEERRYEEAARARQTEWLKSEITKVRAAEERRMEDERARQEDEYLQNLGPKTHKAEPKPFSPRPDPFKEKENADQKRIDELKQEVKRFEELASLRKDKLGTYAKGMKSASGHPTPEPPKMQSRGTRRPHPRPDSVPMANGNFPKANQLPTLTKTQEYSALDKRINEIKRKMEEDQSNGEVRRQQREREEQSRMEEEKIRQMDQLQKLQESRAPVLKPINVDEDMNEFLQVIRNQRKEQELAHNKFQAEASRLESKILAGGFQAGRPIF